MRYKTWQYRIRSEYILRQKGVRVLYRALTHLRYMRWNWSTSSFDGDGNKLAIDLINSVIRKRGNFYDEGGNEFPKWRSGVRRRIVSIHQYFRIVWLALIASEDIGYVD